MNGETENELREMLTHAQVSHLTKMSRTTIYRKWHAGTFPKPMRTDSGRLLWYAADVLDWQHKLPRG